MGKVNLFASNQIDKMVATPGGMRLRSDVQLIESGFHITVKDGTATKVNTETNDDVKELGKINSVDTEDFITRNKPEKEPMTTIKESVTTLPITDKWIIYSGWKNDSNNPITYFSTNWIVPPPPATDNGQLIYLFNGIQNSASNVILQPVLQWGLSPAGGGSFWAIANWFVTGSMACHGSLIPVNTGDNLQGIMVLTEQTENLFNYSSSFKGYTNADLYVAGIDELTWANEALECYDLKQFSDYPNTTTTTMAAIEIKTGTSQANILWEANNDVTDNGQHCSIVSNDSPGGRVDLYYKQII